MHGPGFVHVGELGCVDTLGGAGLDRLDVRPEAQGFANAGELFLDSDLCHVFTAPPDEPTQPSSSKVV